MSLQGRYLIVTAGPTIEPLDPVRFLSNHSSGKMGYAIAGALAARGAHVALVSGRTCLPTPAGTERIDVLSAEEMYRAVMERFPQADGAVMCAAVADYTPAEVNPTKIKKGDGEMVVRLKRTKDIAAEAGRMKGHRLLVGFALETDNERNNALDKMRRKNFDFIVLNSLRDKGAGFSGDTNKITVIDRQGHTDEYPLEAKPPPRHASQTASKRGSPPCRKNGNPDERGRPPLSRISVSAAERRPFRAVQKQDCARTEIGLPLSGFYHYFYGVNFQGRVMRKGLTVLAMAIVSLGAPSCIELKQPQEQVQTEEFKWVVDTFDDIKVLQYKVPGFENLSLDQKKLIYYLNQAALSGRDIIFDQNFKYNLPIRRTLEAIYTNYRGDRTTAEWKAFEKYLKKVWFANGIHHHYSSDKFTPEFSEAYFDTLVASVPAEKLPHDFGSAEQLTAIIKPVIFDPALYPVRVNQAAGADLLKSSAMNYYEGVSQREAEAFYARMAKPGDPQPISYGLNSQLVKQNGKLTERVWKTDGMYAPALEKIVYWLEKAAEVVSPVQKETIEALISFYNTGDLKEYDRFNILWVQDTASMVDFVNGFTEVYGDPLGYKASWEAMVNFKDMDATRRTEIISANAQWFEDHSPIQEKYRKRR